MLTSILVCVVLLFVVNETLKASNMGGYHFTLTFSCNRCKARIEGSVLDLFRPCPACNFGGDDKPKRKP
jgi:hypothetical protein